MTAINRARVSRSWPVGSGSRPARTGRGPVRGGTAPAQGARSPVRSSAALTATALLGLVLSACGGVPSGGTHASGTLDTLLAVRTHATAAHSARVSVTVTDGTRLSETGTGVRDWSHGIHQAMTLHITGGTQTAALRAQGRTTLVVRYLPDTLYSDQGARTAARLGGLRWFAYSYALLAQLTKPGGGSGVPLDAQDDDTSPAQSVSVLLAAPQVRRVGEGTVDGSRAVHYRGAVAAGSLTGRLHPGLTAAQTAAIRANLVRQGITTQTVDLWVSADGLPLRTTTTAASDHGTVTRTVTYSDYGLPVHVEAPPAAETYVVKPPAAKPAQPAA
ncbi:hypothetical protein [Actinacidiphila guanduensis]|uniref:Lipoprotein n=1 Tax=Actinacidiphila guanduensis TaxID=310781 RepID=A0A1H0IXK5_9ACTN|nr:hypothetical protein [Actinacidiphila guanduensis]SDO36248.1 hypothetical protein SAMN05216259_109159 [Actinacidiphila guanduensis]